MGMAQGQLNGLVEEINNVLRDDLQWVKADHGVGCVVLITRGHLINTLSIRNDGSMELLLKLPECYDNNRCMYINLAIGPQGLKYTKFVVGPYDATAVVKRQVTDDNVKLKYDSLYYEDDILHIRLKEDS